MSFSVEPSALVSYARQLDRASDDTSAITGYINSHAKDATGGELIAIAAEGHQHAVTVITDTLRRLTTMLDASGPDWTPPPAARRSAGPPGCVTCPLRATVTAHEWPMPALAVDCGGKPGSGESLVATDTGVQVHVVPAVGVDGVAAFGALQ